MTFSYSLFFLVITMFYSCNYYVPSYLARIMENTFGAAVASSFILAINLNLDLSLKLNIINPLESSVKFFNFT